MKKKFLVSSEKKKNYFEVIGSKMKDEKKFEKSGELFFLILGMKKSLSNKSGILFTIKMNFNQFGI